MRPWKRQRDKKKKKKIWFQDPGWIIPTPNIYFLVFNNSKNYIMPWGYSPWFKKINFRQSWIKYKYPGGEGLGKLITISWILYIIHLVCVYNKTWVRLNKCFVIAHYINFDSVIWEVRNIQSFLRMKTMQLILHILINSYPFRSIRIPMFT